MQGKGFSNACLHARNTHTTIQVTNVLNKEDARILAKQQTKAIAEELRQAASKRICKNLQSFLKSYSPKSGPKTIGTFAATSLEPNLAQLHELLPSFSFAYPLILKKGKMEFYLVEDHGSLELGKYNILAPNPKKHQKIKHSEIDAILCPAWAYSRTFHRLGKGGGYYDRYLSQRPNFTAFGVHFEEMFWDYLPVESHDVPVLSCISESKIRTR